MHFEPYEVYHVYNRGNRKQTVFFSHSNYLLFLEKIKKEWRPFCDLLQYCLMPNHFHFVLTPNIAGCQTVTIGEKDSYLQEMSKAIGKSLSSYTRAVNAERDSYGNLFQKKTKAKCLTLSAEMSSPLFARGYLENNFHYVHNNPAAAGLVKNLADWPYSSWHEYYGNTGNMMCNKALAINLLGLTDYDLKINSENTTKKGLILR